MQTVPIKALSSTIASVFLAAAFAAAPGFAQGQNPGQQYPQPQYPQNQYPQNQYPQNQYPQNQYPQNPYPQNPYPQNPYPQNEYPQSQYPAGQYPQGQYGQPPMLPPQQLDQLVSRVALYPDSLLAQVLTASTFSNQIPEAAGWANAHQYLRGDDVAQAAQADNLPWDPSVLGLLPFPQVLGMMANDMGWTQQLGNSVLAQRGDVMDAVQRMRQQAYNFGYLRPNQYEGVRMVGPGDIEIAPAAPGAYYVPYYDPYVVYARPRPGFFIGSAIRFGPAITVGSAFAPFGWGGAGFGWRDHTILMDNRPWDRNWVNRGAYAHPYAEPYRRVEGPRVERHEERREDRHEDRRDDHRGDHRDDHHH